MDRTRTLQSASLRSVGASGGLRRRIVTALAIAAALTAGAAMAAPAPETETLRHVVEPGDTLHDIAGRYREASGHYARDEMLAAIREANGLEGHLLHPGQLLIIPPAASAPAPITAAPTRDGSDLRGIYLPGPLCGTSAVFARVDSFVAVGGNGVVIDAKDVDGGVCFRSRQPLAVWGKGRPGPVIGDLPELLRRLHARDLWVVARLALFLDGELGRQRPDLALRGPGGEPWTERGCVWLDPSLREVRDHNLGLAVELARAGVNEIQLDYVRYPTNGWPGEPAGSATSATADRDSVARRRCAVIASFLDELGAAVAPHGVRISADLYGIAAWDRLEDLVLTGQHVPTIAERVDFLCPMIYPSHFGPGFAGVERPADEPEAFIAEGVRRFAAAAGGRAEIRPWLQAFAWRVTDYDGTYVARQVAAAEATGAAGWCLWNPAGRYETAVAGLRGRTIDLRPTTVALASREPTSP